MGIYFYFNYTGRKYSQELNEVWHAYYVNQEEKKIDDEILFDIEIIKQNNDVTISYNNSSCTITLFSYPYECSNGNLTTRFTFSDNFDAMEIVEYEENSIKNIYLAFSNNIPFFINNNRIKLIKKINGLGRVIFD